MNFGIDSEFGASAEELELSKLAELKLAIEDEVQKARDPRVRERANPIPSSIEGLFDGDVYSENKKLEEKNRSLTRELELARNLLTVRGQELRDRETKVEKIARDKEKAVEELEAQKKEFEKKIENAKAGYVESLKREQKRFEDMLKNELLSAEEKVERERLFREKSELERIEHASKVEALTVDLELTKNEIEKRDSIVRQVQAEFSKSKSTLEERTRYLQELEAKLKVLEAERTLLTHHLEEKKKLHNDELSAKEAQLLREREEEKARFEESLRSERIEAEAKLLREQATRKNLEEQKSAANERMIELAWELKQERNRGAGKPTTTQKARELAAGLAPQREEKVIPPQASVESFAASAALWKRAASGAVDILFVGTLWLMAIVFTANIYSDFAAGVSPLVLNQFANSDFLMAIAVQYFVLWVTYELLCVVVFSRTTGMWVWDLAFDYGSATSSSVWERKIMRALLNAFFYAPLFPLLLLVIQAGQRHLLDRLSHSSVTHLSP